MSEIRIGVNIEGELAEKFLAVKKHLAIGNNADVVRWLINWYFEKENLKLKEKPRIKHFNIDEYGVTLVDERLKTENSPFGRILQVYFKNGKAICELCKTQNCEHVKYALSLKKVREIFRRKGWKLPDV